MKKILVISNMYPSKEWPHYGVFVKNSSEILRSRGYDVDVVAMGRSTNMVQKCSSYIILYIKALCKGIFGKYDVIYAHYASHTGLPVTLIKLLRKDLPLVMNVHGNDVVPETKKDEKYQKIVRIALSKSERIVCPSLYYKKILEDIYKISSTKIVVYPSGGVDTNHFHPMDKNVAKQHFSLDQNYRYVGYVSRIEENKGWNLFLEAGKKVTEQYDDVRLIVVGDGVQNKEYEELVSRLGIQDKVIKYTLLSQSELVFVYNMLDVFVFPTYRKSESLGLVGLEAMACQTVVVASDKYGPSSYMSNCINGYTFEAGNAEDLFRKILFAMDIKAQEKQEIIDNARLTAKKFSNVDTGDILEKMFDEVTLLAKY